MDLILSVAFILGWETVSSDGQICWWVLRFYWSEGFNFIFILKDWLTGYTIIVWLFFIQRLEHVILYLSTFPGFLRELHVNLIENTHCMINCFFFATFRILCLSIQGSYFDRASMILLENILFGVWWST
jgi:hypothetical protein